MARTGPRTPPRQQQQRSRRPRLVPAALAAAAAAAAAVAAAARGPLFLAAAKPRGLPAAGRQPSPPQAEQPWRGGPGVVARRGSSGAAEAPRGNEQRADSQFEENSGNWPILVTVLLLGVSFALRQDVIAIFALYQFSSSMEANWMVESAHVLLRLPWDLLSEYGDAAIANPVLTKALTSGAAYVAGDLLAQVFEGRRRVVHLDLSRCGRNGAAGFLLHGPGLHYWIQFLEGPFTTFLGGAGVANEWWAIASKIALDQTVFSAALNTLYALLIGAMAAKPMGEVLRRTRETLAPAMLSSWRFWPFVHLITYSPLMPIEFKVLWNDVAEIVWVAILSVIANSGAEAAGEEEVPSEEPTSSERRKLADDLIAVGGN